MARALGAVKQRRAVLQVGQQLLVGRAGAFLAGEGLLNLLLQKVGADDLVDVLFLGHAALLEGFLPLVLALEHGLGLGELVVDLGLLDLDALLLGRLVEQELVGVEVDDLLADGLGRVAVGDHPLAPGIVVGEVGGLAELGDVLRDGLLADGLAVQGGGSALGGIGDTVAAGSAAGHGGNERRAHRHGAEALEIRKCKHRVGSLPVALRKLPHFSHSNLKIG